MAILLGVCRMGLALSSAEDRRTTFTQHADYLRSWDWGVPLVGVIFSIDDPLTYLAPLRELRESNIPFYIQVPPAPENNANNRALEVPLDEDDGRVEEDRLEDPEDVPLYLLIQEVLDSLPPFTPLPEFPPTTREWSPLVLDNARLVVDDLSEVKLRIKALLDELPANGVLTHAVERGIPFRFVAPIEKLKLMLPRGFKTDEGRPPYLSRAYVDLPLAYQSDPIALWAQYCVKVYDLLQRPHSVAFLCKGGMEWRLAIHFNGPTLLDVLHARLSTTSAGFYHGFPYVEGHLGDDVSSHETLVLLGTCIDPVSGMIRSWWPTQTSRTRSGSKSGLSY
ncbi:hypothetical protein NLI96_g11302 [Meripilus lineatus]|uniref:Uncharacterized protein n=1 Tax=Meripilus lineatus TaxID=2056292 RepID=A0AAD5USB9_9APHY|nr:hypothetical protein NLI96_g11302 [Physisporinus lineatus]